MAEYTFISEHMVQRFVDGAFIPIAPGNRDYDEYLEWLAKGNKLGMPKPVEVVSSPEPIPLPDVPDVPHYSPEAELAMKEQKE